MAFEIELTEAAQRIIVFPELTLLEIEVNADQVHLPRLDCFPNKGKALQIFERDFDGFHLGQSPFCFVVGIGMVTENFLASRIRDGHPLTDEAVPFFGCSRHERANPAALPVTQDDDVFDLQIDDGKFDGGAGSVESHRRGFTRGHKIRDVADDKEFARRSAGENGWIDTRVTAADQECFRRLPGRRELVIDRVFLQEIFLPEAPEAGHETKNCFIHSSASIRASAGRIQRIIDLRIINTIS